MTLSYHCSASFI